ncbi:four helix bundle protein [Thermohalobacter berrensis]|uniref:Four helix bundle protein n=1 Tax=Thermohalobacter berrensis TaxID=99594 RepID=A0A419T4F7_9FIRM|nr:four helix bundle protein [Thermohalobacter berrensis]RKD32329.1 four helix bundle protein [Thermohalobacter berrensis]
MKDNNLIKEKSYNFALRIVKMYKYVIKEKREYVMSKQLLRSGTSIGANVEEACAGQSKKDFISKFSIALKEAFETRYWLRLIKDSNMIESKYVDSMISDCNELISILTKIIKTAKNN